MKIFLYLNFARGILITDAFDVLIENCRVAECQVGLRIESISLNGTEFFSQIKLVGGFFLQNEYHISVDNADNRGGGDIFLYGWTAGHQRTTKSGKALGIGLYQAVAAISLYGCHFEDLKYGINVWKMASPCYVGSLTVVGCNFEIMELAAIEASSNATIGALTAIGNRFAASGGGTPTIPFLKAPVVQHGVLIGGNNRGSFNQNNYPKTGYAEVSTSTDERTTFRVSEYTTASRPSANSVLKGTVIYNSTTGKLNVSNGTSWLEV